MRFAVRASAVFPMNVYLNRVSSVQIFLHTISPVLIILYSDTAEGIVCTLLKWRNVLFCYYIVEIVSIVSHHATIVSTTSRISIQIVNILNHTPFLSTTDRTDKQTVQIVSHIRSDYICIKKERAEWIMPGRNGLTIVGESL